MSLSTPGCDIGPGSVAADAPAVQLVEVLVTTGVDADGAPIRSRVANDGTTRGVLGTSSIILRFDRFLDPLSPTRQAICLQPTLGRTTSYLDCQGVDFLQPTYDPVWRRVEYRQQAGARLAAQTTYQLTIFRAPDDAAPGFRAFDGAPFGQDATLELATAAMDPPAATDELPPKGDRFCEDAPCLEACEAAPTVKACGAPCAITATACAAACATEACRGECATAAASCRAACIGACRARCPAGVARLLGVCAGCHGASVDGPDGFVGAAAGLDLSSSAGIVATALGQVAHQTQTGEHAARGEAHPARFGRAMPIVSPGFPGDSYLLYKQIVGADYAASEAAPALDEIERLRATVVVGMPMPPAAGTWPGLGGLAQQTRWIGLGAETQACP